VTSAVNGARSCFSARSGCESSAVLTLEMYRRDHFNETLVIERCAELVAIEARVSELEALLQGARGLRRRGAAICACGAPALMGARFCPSCGRSLIDERAQPEASG